jgi:hypothetical protein
MTQLDIDYARNKSLSLDLIIILKTIPGLGGPNEGNTKAEKGPRRRRTTRTQGFLPGLRNSIVCRCGFQRWHHDQQRFLTVWPKPRSNMAKQIKVGVVGCGYWGPNLIRNFRAIADCSMTVMCDLNEKRLAHLKSLYPEVEGVTDYSHTLNGLGLDAVAIATSVKLHHPMAKASLLAGKHTFIEKPMASLIRGMRGVG